MKRRAVPVLLSFLLLCGCSRISLTRITSRAMSDVENLLARSTVTLPVLATPRPAETSTPIPATPTPAPSATPTVSPTPTEMILMTPTFIEADLSVYPLAAAEKFDSVSDVTWPDGSVLEPGQIIAKSFRMRNAGEGIWEEGMKVAVQCRGLDMPELMNAVFTKPTDLVEFSPGTWGNRVHNVTPGEKVDLVIPICVPTEPGEYQIDFRLITADGRLIPTQLWMRFRVAAATETPTPEPTGTAEPPARPFNWNGLWMIRDPYTVGEMIPKTAWMYRDPLHLTGFFFDDSGDPVMIYGSLLDEGRIFIGEFGHPWQTKTDQLTWRMAINRRQFSAVTEDGAVGVGCICGARDDEKFPDSCALSVHGS